MTWLKLSDDFGDECAQADLSDAAFRTHVEGLLWTMRRESAGRLKDRDIRRFAESTEADRAVAELLKVGFWLDTGDGYVIEHHMEVQAQPEDLKRQRLVAAERQRRAREKKTKAALESTRVDPSRRDDTRDVTRDTQGDPGLGWSGLDRKPPNYVAPKYGRDKDAISGPEEDWPRLPPCCEVCSGVLDSVLVAAGDRTHPTCG